MGVWRKLKFWWLKKGAAWNYLCTVKLGFAPDFIFKVEPPKLEARAAEQTGQCGEGCLRSPAEQRGGLPLALSKCGTFLAD